MKGNIKKTLPTILSIIIFSGAFIFLILRSSYNPEEKAQLSPKNYLYKEKYGDTKSYNHKDISTNGLITNVRINQTAGTSEPKVVCNPVQKNFLAVSANDFSAKNGVARIFVSSDTGANWEARDIPLSSRFKESSYSDPYMDFDSFGNLYFISVQSDLNNGSREGIFFGKSTDNGSSWKSDFNFIDYNGKENIMLDRPKIYIDKSGVNKNIIYITWIELKAFDSFIMFSKSTDGGRTFSSPMKLEKNDVEYCSLISNSKGDLFLIYLKEDEKIIVKKSVDDGNSWSKEIASLKIIPAGIKSENQYYIKDSGKNGIRVNSEPAVLMSDNGDLLITYSAAGEGNDISDIYFTRLKTDINEIEKPSRVNSDKTRNDQFLPAIAADEYGNFVIIYQDSRNDINNVKTETYASVSTDGGINFYDEKISTDGYNSSLVAVDKYMGDYNSCVFSDNKFIGVWTDGRNDNLDIYAGLFDLNKIIENMNR